MNPGDYRSARIGATFALVAATVFILVYDALSVDYETSQVVLGMLLGAVAALVGVTIRKDGAA